MTTVAHGPGPAHQPAGATPHPYTRTRRPGPVYVADHIGLARRLDHDGVPRATIAEILRVNTAQLLTLLAGYDPWRPRNGDPQ